jgi:hypothetical protein
MEVLLSHNPLALARRKGFLGTRRCSSTLGRGSLALESCPRPWLIGRGFSALRSVPQKGLLGTWKFSSTMAHWKGSLALRSAHRKSTSSRYLTIFLIFKEQNYFLLSYTNTIHNSFPSFSIPSIFFFLLFLYFFYSFIFLFTVSHSLSFCVALFVLCVIFNETFNSIKFKLPPLVG